LLEVYAWLAKRAMAAIVMKRGWDVSPASFAF